MRASCNIVVHGALYRDSAPWACRRRRIFENITFRCDFRAHVVHGMCDFCAHVLFASSCCKVVLLVIFLWAELTYICSVTEKVCLPQDGKGNDSC